MEQKQSVGFIGLGAMGSVIANHIMEAGWPLVVYSRAKTSMRPFIDKGAVAAANAREVAERAEVIVTMVTDDDAVHDVAFMRNGLFAVMGEGKIWIDMTTTSPELAEEMASAAEKLGARMLVVRASGCLEEAQKGELVLIAGGDPEALERVRPIMETFSSKIIYFGGHGSAAAAKLALNILLGLEMQALAEALVFAEKQDIDPEVMAEAIGSSMVASPHIETKLKQIMSGDYGKRFKLRLLKKDFELVLKEAGRMSVSLPCVAAANETAKTGLATGYGNFDIAAIYLALGNLAGVKKEPVGEVQEKEPSPAI